MEDVAKYVRSCRVCQSVKVERHNTAGVMASRVGQVKHPWEVICTDLIGPLPRSTKGHRFILTVVDYYTKYALVIPLRNATAKEVVQNLEEQVFLIYGAPDSIVCDNGVQFKSRQMKELADEYGAKLEYTAFYHPQANPAERVNQEIKRMIRSYVGENHRHWDKQIAKIGCALRTYTHEGMKVSPYAMNFGRNMNVKGDKYRAPEQEDGIFDSDTRASSLENWRKKIWERMRKQTLEKTAKYNLRNRERKFEVGDWVWRRNYAISDANKYFAAKLAPEYVGPYKIVGKDYPATYSLEDKNGKTGGNWNVKDLKMYVE